MRVIETVRCRLEPQLAAHAEAMFAVLSDPAIYEYENEPPPSLQWLRDRFARLESRRSSDGSEEWLNWVVVFRETSALIGYVQATVRSDGTAAIAYELSSSRWGRGFGSEAVQGMIDELVCCHRVRSLTAVLKRENFRSRRLLERLGFSVAPGELRTRLHVADDELLMIRDAGRR